ncbi:MAG TPA: S9 family peptidase [Candidatus Baltobacteraceae bacterium]|nr:S9 family peptidase [Candidatus Baltobacteraceae bacterium]
MRALITVAFFALCAQTLASADSRTISEDDVTRLVSLGSPVVAPDGKTAVVEVSRIVWNDDRRARELVSVDLASGAQRVLTYDRKGLSDPAFSPDGTRLAFIADQGSGDDAKSQVFVLPLNGGDARPITDAKAGVDQFSWRPDGKAIAYVADDATPERKGADKFRDSFVFTTQPITAREPAMPAHLYVVSAQGGRADQLTFGPESVAVGEAQSTLSWSPDGRTIAFTIAPNAILNDESYSHVALLDVASKSLRALTPHTAWETTPLFSPDGKHIAYLYSDGDNQVNLTQLYVTTPDGGAGTAISAPMDRSVADFAWLPDSSGLIFAAPDRSMTALVRAPLHGALQRIDLGERNISSSVLNAMVRGGALAFVATSTKEPQELFVRSASGDVRRLTNYNSAIAQLRLGSSERITYPTSTGMQGDAVLFTPPGFSPARKYPMVVYIHGGPTSSSTQSFDFYSQVMAARGWLVLRPNYRGSDDLGLAYQRAVLYDPEDGPGKDIMAAVDAVRSRGILDDSRIAVSGWSYGGIMTAWMISKYHIWKAAVSGASVNDWRTDYGVADDSLSDRDLFHDSPYVGDNWKEWRQASAITYAADVTTPVLILSDVGDNRDPFATSSMYWRALRDNHKDATLRVWPVNGHFPSDPVRSADVYHYWIGYIADHFR